MSAVLAVPGFAFAADANAKIQQIAKEMVLGTAKDHPISATYSGIAGYDSELDRPSPALMRRDLLRIRSWRRRLDAIPTSGASLAAKNDILLLKARLTASERALTVYRTWDKDYSAPANSIVNVIYIQFQFLPIAGRDGATARDVQVAWQNITARLAKAPEYIRAGQRMVTHPGVCTERSGRSNWTERRASWAGR